MSGKILRIFALRRNIFVFLYGCPAESAPFLPLPDIDVRTAGKIGRAFRKLSPARRKTITKSFSCKNKSFILTTKSFIYTAKTFSYSFQNPALIFAAGLQQKNLRQDEKNEGGEVKF